MRGTNMNRISITMKGDLPREKEPSGRRAVRKKNRPEEEPLTVKGSEPIGVESNYEAGESEREN